MNRFRITLIATALTVFPSVAFAQVNSLQDLIQMLLRMASQIAPLLVGVAIVLVFWNLAQFILKAGDEEEREKYKQFMIWSVIGVFAMLSFWGLVYFIVNTFFGGGFMLQNPGFVNSKGMPV